MTQLCIYRKIFAEENDATVKLPPDVDDDDDDDDVESVDESANDNENGGDSAAEVEGDDDDVGNSPWRQLVRPGLAKNIQINSILQML